MTDFASLGLSEPLLKALQAEGYTTPTPIQAQSIPYLLAGKDMLGLAQTGTGKTAAFSLPLLQRLEENYKRPAPKSCRMLVLTPTRELAVQVHESIGAYGRHLRLKRCEIFGGVGMVPQIKRMSGGVDILVATPGRLLDLMGQGHIRLDHVEVLVLDEADRMLDMGFIPAIRKIVAAVPKVRQTVLFSATMPETIASLAAGVLHCPERVEVVPQSTTAAKVEQKVMFVSREDKRTLLTDLLGDKAIERALVFTRTKHGANRVAELLDKSGIPADAIHGNKSQGARQKALSSLRDGSIRVLVATDIAARGIDIDGITHVVNFELPNEPESYVHRIGRTARAGASGQAISLCDMDEVPLLRAIEKTIRQQVNVDDGHGFHAEHIARRASGQGGGGRGPGGGQQARGGAPGAKPKARPHAQNGHQNQPQPHGQSARKPQGSGGGKPQGKQGGFQGRARSGGDGFPGLPGGSKVA
jgi:ATP-dependent RNA helicase RhlE